MSGATFGQEQQKQETQLGLRRLMTQLTYKRIYAFLSPHQAAVGMGKTKLTKLSPSLTCPSSFQLSPHQSH